MTTANGDWPSDDRWCAASGAPQTGAQLSLDEVQPTLK
jgi:hypothetical protein